MVEWSFTLTSIHHYTDQLSTWCLIWTKLWHNYDCYIAELAAIRELMPGCSHKLEVGVGSGRFAAPLGIEYSLLR